MILREVVLRDFGPFRGRNVIDLAQGTTGDDGPICLIGAENGSGKTTLLDGILLALYGKRARCSKRGTESFEAFLRASIHTGPPSAKQTAVEVLLEFVDERGSEQIRVNRSWRLTKSGVRERLRVNRDSSRDSALADTWDQRVEDLLPLGLSNLFFFDGEEVRDLAVAERPGADVREAVRTLLGLELPERLRRDLVSVLQGLQSMGSAPPRVALGTELTIRIVEVEAEVASLRTEVEQLRPRLAAAEQRAERARADFERCGGALSQIRDELVAAHSHAKAAVLHAEDRLRELCDGPLPLNLLPGLFDRTLDRARREGTHLHSLRSAVELRDRDAAALEQLRGLDAPGDVVTGLAEFLAGDRRERLVGLEPAPYLDSGDALVAQLEELSAERLPRERLAMADALGEKERAKDGLTGAEARIAAAADASEHKRMLTRVESAAQSAAQASMTLEQREKELAAAERELSKLEDEIRRVAERAAEARHVDEETQRAIATAARVDSVLGEYGERLKTRKLAELGRMVTARFKSVAHKQGFIDRIELQGDDFSLHPIGVDGTEVDRRRLSAGEQQLLAVAFLWGLADATGLSLPVVIDTPLGRMDAEHRERLVERYFPHAARQVVLLSTDAEIDARQYQRLRDLGAIRSTHRIVYDAGERRAIIQPGYFW